MDTLKYQVDRSTHGDKMRDFHEWMKAVKKDTLYRVRVINIYRNKFSRAKLFTNHIPEIFHEYNFTNA